MQTIDLRQARRLDPASSEWLLEETEEGWTVKYGDAMLVGINERKPRYFSDVNRAIQRLKEELGIRSMRVVTMQ